MYRLQKRGGRGVSQREQGRGQGERSPSLPPFPSFTLIPTIRVAISPLLNLILCSKIKDGGYNMYNTNIIKQFLPGQNMPALRATS